MKIRELKQLAGKMQISHEFCRRKRFAASVGYTIVCRRAKWEVSCTDQGVEVILGVFDTEEEACETVYRMMKNEENASDSRKPDKIPKEWWITGIRISSRCNADVAFGERIVRMPGELLIYGFLADPYAMFWLAKEDRETLPWNLPEEKRMNKLTDTQRTAVMAAVNDYYRNRTDPILFLTRELEARAFELADMVRNKQFSQEKAAGFLKRDFEDLSDVFCRDMILDALNGVRWYR